MIKIKVQNSFTEELSADTSKENFPRQVNDACFSFVLPKSMSSPKMLIYNASLAKELGLDQAYCKSTCFVEKMAGNSLLENSQPYAMCYGGHQFGHWAGQLGDGRAINLGEIRIDKQHFSLQLKGAGPTPYSRTADGFAVLRSSIREFLCSEAMYHLGIPTTRALSLVTTGEQVLRDKMYDGNAAYEIGAIVCRVSPTFIRFGNFEIFASRGDFDNLKKLADYTIKYYYPHLVSAQNTYLQMFREVAEKTCDMIVGWQRVGFVHGVMNTDNMSILGLTIDYGPYGWMDDYDVNWTPNTTDLPGRRYKFGNQPVIAQWNLLKLASALYPLIGNEESLKDIVHDFKVNYEIKYHKMMLQKLGLYSTNRGDEDLIHQLESLLQSCEVDMTIFFRKLSEIESSYSHQQILDKITPALYSDTLPENLELRFLNWFDVYFLRIQEENKNKSERIKQMNSINPKYVIRNYMAQMAIEESEKGNYNLTHELYELLKNPYYDQPENEKWFSKRPEWAKDKVGCSMLSCSS